MQLCSNAAELCEVQKLKGVTALTSTGVYSWPLRSSTGAVGMNRFPGFSDLHLCSNAAELCEVQKLKGVTALSSKAVYSWPLRSSTGAVGMNRFPRLQ